MSDLKISLLGPPKIELNGAAVTIGRSKALALLFYLAINREPQRRDALATLLWPNSTQSRARSSLRYELFNLNQTLGTIWLDVERETIALNPQAWLDVNQFQQGVAKFVPNNPASCNTLIEAVNLYRGDFLSGFSLSDCPGFDEWQFFQSETLRGQFATTLDHLTQGYHQSNPETALSYARQRLALDPLHEPANRRVMQLYTLLDQQAAALRQYQVCVQMLQDELGLDPAAETTALYEQIRLGRAGSGAAGALIASQPTQAPKTGNFEIRHDLSEAPELGLFYGRESELALLENWLIQEKCRLVGVLGIGGQGKTALATKLLQRLSEESSAIFERVLWKSLLNAPPLDEILPDILHFLAVPESLDLPDSLDKQISLLLDYFNKRRCLLVLDNLESILEVGDKAGSYRSGYEEYDLLIQAIGQRKHQSTLLLTSRERLPGMSRLNRSLAWVKSLELGGLSFEASRQLLETQGIDEAGDPETLLISRYAGHPLALILVAETIDELYFGDISAFLGEETLIFDDIRAVLDQHVARLSPLEREIMIWLAIEREAISLETLRENLLGAVSKREYLEALRSLQRRMLLQAQDTRFGLQNVVLEYTTEYFIDQICTDLANDVLHTFNRHALLKAQAKAYVRESQERLILKPIVDHLVTRFGQAEAEQKLRGFLDELRANMPIGYAAGNILNVLLYLESKVSQADFSGLAVWQAYLQGKTLLEVSLRGADIQQAVFTDTFGLIHSIAFSPNGIILAAGTNEGQIRLWRITDGQPLLTLAGHTNIVRSVAFSPDGQMLVSGSDDQTLRLWNVQTGQCLNTLTAHSSIVFAVAFSPDAQILASGSFDQTLRLWDVQTGQSLKTLTGHSNSVFSVAFSPDGQMLVSGSDDQTLRLWDVQTGQCLNTLTGHSNSIYAVAFSPDAQTLVSGSFDQTLRLWDVETGQCLKILTGHSASVRTVAFSPDGQILASGSDKLRLWDIQTGQIFNTLQGHSKGVISVAFSPDAQTLATASYDHTLRLWDVRTGQNLKILAGYSNSVRAVAFSPDGQVLMSGSDDQTLRLWDVQSGQNFKTLTGHSNIVWSVAYSPNGQILATTSFDQTLRLWDVQTGQCLNTLTGHSNGVTSVAFGPDTEILASGSFDQTLRLWDVQMGQCLKTLLGHSSAVWSVDFSPDGQTLASSSEDQTLRLWDIQSGQSLKVFTGHTDWVTSVAFSPDGQTLVSGSFDQTLRLWDAQTGQCLKTLVGHSDIVRSVAFSPDGQTLVSGSFDQTLRLWNVQTGQCLKTLIGHSNAVRSVAFSPDGQILASASLDETIKFWDIQSNDCRKTLRPTRPYTGMNITHVTGLSQAQIDVLKELGAVTHH